MRAQGKEQTRMGERQEEGAAPLQYLYTRRGRALELLGQFNQALKNYEEMESAAEQRGDSAMKLSALIAEAKIRSTANTEFNPSEGEALSERALKLARELNDRACEAIIWWNLLNLYRFTSRMSQAIEVGERSLSLARELGLREPLAYTLNDLAFPYMFSGQLEKVQAMLTEAIALWRELGNRPMLADSLATLSGADVYTGRFDDAIAASQEAWQISQTTRNLWGQSYSLFQVGYVYFERGEIQRAIETMETCIRLAEPSGFAVPQTMVRSYLARVYAHMGAVQHALELAQLALTQAERLFPMFRSLPLALLATLHAMNGNLAEAQATFETISIPPGMKNALAMFMLPVEIELHWALHEDERVIALADDFVGIARASGLRMGLADALSFKGRALLRQGHTDQAEPVLRRARAEAEALGSRRALWPILFFLSQIEAQHGNRSEATTLRQQAQDLIAYIVGHIGDPALRTSFLNLPDVRAVLDDARAPD